jgi:hypothetical protein
MKTKHLFIILALLVASCQRYDQPKAKDEENPFRVQMKLADTNKDFAEEPSEPTPDIKFIKFIPDITRTQRIIVIEKISEELPPVDGNMMNERGGIGKALIDDRN